MPLHSIYNAYDRSAAPPPPDGVDSGAKIDAFRFCPGCGSELQTRAIADQPRLACPRCEYVRFRNPTPTLSVVLLRGGQIVLGKRKAEPGAGKWAIPSGYIEYNEDFIDAGQREFRAETGLEVTICGVLHVASSFLSPRDHFFYLYLQAELTGGELCPGDDLAEAAWFPLAGPLPELAFHEDADLIAAMLAAQPGGLPALPVVHAAGKTHK